MTRTRPEPTQEEYDRLVQEIREQIKPMADSWFKRVVERISKYWKFDQLSEFEPSDDDMHYGWQQWFTTRRNHVISIKLQIYESAQYDGSYEGVNFNLTIDLLDQDYEHDDDEERRYADIINWCLHNFTDKVWVDVRSEWGPRNRLVELFNLFTPEHIVKCLKRCESDRSNGLGKEWKL